MTNKQMTDALRASYTEDIKVFLKETYGDVCQTASGTLMVPALKADGTETWVKVSIAIPKDATEEAGTDGYSLAQEYQLKLEKAAQRKAEAERKAAERKAKADARAAAKAAADAKAAESQTILADFEEIDE